MRQEDLPRYRLKTIRRERQISQATLAKALFVKNTTISNWENGTRQIHLEAIQQLSAYFNVPVSYFTEKNQSALPTQRKNQSVYTLSAVIALVVSTGVFLFTRSPNLAIDACYGETNCYLIQDTELISELSSRQISGGLMTNIELEKVYDFLDDYRWVDEERLQTYANRAMIETYLYYFNHDYKTYDTDQYYQFIGYFVNEDAHKAQDYLNFETINIDQKQYFVHEDIKYVLYKTGFESFVFEVFADSYLKYVLDINFDALYFGEQKMIKGLERTISGMLSDSRQGSRQHGDGAMEYYGWKPTDNNQLHYGSTFYQNNHFSLQAHIYDYETNNAFTIEFADTETETVFLIRMNDLYFYYPTFIVESPVEDHFYQALKALQFSSTPILSGESNASFEELASVILPHYDAFDFDYLFPVLQQE
jgi:transcriptional regulator with XRE-family HTH domain